MLRTLRDCAYLLRKLTVPTAKRDMSHAKVRLCFFLFSGPGFLQGSPPPVPMCVFPSPGHAAHVCASQQHECRRPAQPGDALCLHCALCCWTRR